MMLEKKIDATINWLRSMAENAGAKGLLVGVSGGIDSAVVSFLIKQAMPTHSLGVILPCKSHEQDQKDAYEVIQAAHLDSVEVDLTQTHDVLFGNIQGVLQNKGEWVEENNRLTDANLRARLRMSTLYAIAQNRGYLVVGTDNAAEWHLGYFTKYGDGGVDCVPIANLTKGEVREWARELGVPQAILDKAPSAGLWAGQTDEDELGISYAQVDRYLLGEEIPEHDKRIIETLHKRSEHKRHMPPKPPAFHTIR